MRDTRTNQVLFNDVTISTATTTNSTAIDLDYTGVAGTLKEGTRKLGIELILFTVSGTNNNIKIKWQTSTDNSNWVDADSILTSATGGDYDLDANVTATTGALRVSASIETPWRYVRVAIVTTTMTTSSFHVNGFVSDGATYFQRGTQVRVT